MYVKDVPAEGAAAKAGLKKGDIITKINNNNVATGLEMSAQIASLKPGDKISLAYLRNKKEYTTDLILKESAGKIDIAGLSNIKEILGADLETLDKKKANTYQIEGGVVVKKIASGGPISRTRMEEGFIITSLNGKDVTSVEDLTKALNNINNDNIYVEGIYPDADGVYRYPLNIK